MEAAQRRMTVGVGAAVLALLLFGNGGFRTLVTAGFERRHLNHSILSLHTEHDTLTHELTLLQQDPDYTEYLVRKKLGYVEKGEFEYRLVKSPHSD